MTNSRYDMQEWAAATTRGRHIFNYNFRMTGDELKGWELVNTVIMEETPGLTERVYIWEKKGSKGQELIRIDISELNDWRTAQGHLQGHLSHCMHPGIPRGKGKLAKTGDVGFMGQEAETKAVAGVFFSRGNVSVVVNSVGDKGVDVSRVAQLLDRTLGEPPQEEEIRKGLIKAPETLSLKVRHDEPVTVIERLPEPVPRNGWLKVIAPDGELSRQDDTILYRPAEDGEKPIAKYVTVR